MTNTSDGALLGEVARLHLQLQRSCVASCGDTGATQCFILEEIYRNGPVTLADLGRSLNLDKGWLSRTVEALVQQGCLVKELNSEDRRSVMISMSNAGRNLYEELDQSLNAQVEQVMSHIPAKQRPMIYEALRLLRDALRTQTHNESLVKTRKAKCAS